LSPIIHRVGHVRRELELVLPLAGRDVLAAGRDDDVLHPVGDVEVAVVVDPADVAGVQPAVASIVSAVFSGWFR
jgi:hypothetical protein